MIIGILGLGIVGSAVKYGMEKLGHIVKCHDIKMNTSLNDVIETDICFICVPTPSREDGSCDTSIVEDVVLSLHMKGYKGIIAIKSTVEPGLTESLQNKFSNQKICFVPEFLRERCAVSDFMENHDICVIGTQSVEIFEKVKKSHGIYPEDFIQVSPTEAEFVKYMNNVHNAVHIVLSNSFYELCKASGAEYTKVKEALVKRKHITDIYLDCNENFRGFGGMCLPKDPLAMAYLCEKLKVDIEFFRNLLVENDKYKITCYDNMRG